MLRLAEAGMSDQPVLDDYSGAFASMRTRLSDNHGQPYIPFVRSLQPNYRIVYRDIAIGYAALIITAVLTVLAPSWGVHWLIAAVLGALSIGYWIAYLQLFIHEGAHYNLAADKKTSDRLCDLLISWMIGTSVADYRIVHFQHHRFLGTVDDAEHSYFFPLNLVFLIKAGLGIRAIEVFLFRQKKVEQPARKMSKLAPVLIGGTIHLIIVACGFLFGAWWFSLAWMAGVGVVFPFLGALRQILEHRHEGDAGAKTRDFTKEDHGAYTRIFGDDVFSATFGGAGFNRHLLHHWEPQLSYTNLPELENFLRNTEMAPIMDARRSSYADTFLKLISLH